MEVGLCEHLMRLRIPTLIIKEIHMSSEIIMQMRQTATNTIWNWHLSCTNCMLHILGELAAEITMPI